MLNYDRNYITVSEQQFVLTTHMVHDMTEWWSALHGNV